MTTVAQLDVDTVSVEAGDHARLSVDITNTGDTVEDYLIEIMGVPAAWTTVEPPTLTLYPGTQGVAAVDVHPPRASTVPAGEVHLGIHVVPTQHPEQAVVPEAVVEVLPYLETTAELVPRTSHGRFGARHQVAIDNRGNVPVSVLLIPLAGSDVIDVETRPGSLTVEPGHAAFADVRVRPLQRLWRGAPRTVPFSITAAPQGSPEVELEAGHVQEAILPAWLPKALIALLAALLLLAALWAFLLRRTIEAAAKDAVAEPVRSAQADAAAAEQAAAQAGQAQTDANQSAGQAGAAAKKAEQIVDPRAPGKPRLVTAPFSARLTVTAAKGAQDTDTFTLGAKQTMTLTDFVLENTQGDSGTLTLSLGDRVLLTQALESFRTTDYHFVTPFVAAPKEVLRLRLACSQPGLPPAVPPPTKCANAVTFGGQMTQPSS